MTRPRDSRRQRLYDSQEHGDYSATAIRLLGPGGDKVPSTGSVTIEAVQAYVDHVTSAAWFQRRWGRRHITARHKVYGSATGGGSTITMPPWSRNEMIILHEIAHCLTPSRYAPHGPEFAGVFLTLVRHAAGAEVGRRLRERFRENRVRVSMLEVPKPTRTVVTRSAEVSAKRAAAKQPLTPQEARRAADLLARGIAAGQFGAVGTASRTAAGSAKRGLVKVAGA